MSGMEIASFAASLASLLLAVVAIWLSLFFYRMTSQLAESTKEAAKDIGSSVERLEKLFDKLYADTFSMMRDTYSDMRKHIWPAEDQSQRMATEETEKKANERVQALKDEVQQQVADLLKRQKVTDERLTSITRELSPMVDRVINQSRKVDVDAREETIRENIMQTLRKVRLLRHVILADEVVSRLSGQFPSRRVIEELERMKVDGRISFDGNALGPETVIHMRD